MGNFESGLSLSFMSGRGDFFATYCTSWILLVLVVIFLKVIFLILVNHSISSSSSSSCVIKFSEPNRTGACLMSTWIALDRLDRPPDIKDLFGYRPFGALSNVFIVQVFKFLVSSMDRARILRLFMLANDDDYQLILLVLMHWRYLTSHFTTWLIRKRLTLQRIVAERRIGMYAFFMTFCPRITTFSLKNILEWLVQLLK